MTDIEYTYQQDIREKKAAGRGAFSKRTGSKTRYVSLSQNHMTDAQLKRRNGPLKTYNITAGIRDWKTFAELPTDLRKEYIDQLRAAYRIRMEDLARSLGISRSYLAHFLMGEYKWGRGGSNKLGPNEFWPDFLAGRRDAKGYLVPGAQPDPVKAEATDEDEPVTAVEVMPVEVDKMLVAKPDAQPYKVKLYLVDTPDKLAELIALVTDPNTKYDFKVVIKQKGGDM